MSDFPLQLSSVLASERSQCREELARMADRGEEQDILSLSRGALHAVESRLADCRTANDVLAVIVEQGRLVQRLGEGRGALADTAGYRRSLLAYLWHLGQFVEMDLVARHLKLYARHNKNG